MTRDDLAALVLRELASQCEAIRTRPAPPRWNVWAILDDRADREFGPCYTPTWFGALTATEAGRVRVLRTVHRLAVAGLLTMTRGEGGRLKRVRLTRKGLEAIAVLTATELAEN